MSEGPWTGANSTPRLGGYTSARVTPDVMASDAETNADRRVFSVCICARDCQLVDVAAAQHAHGDV